MSVCGGCPYPKEMVLEGECETAAEACQGDCTFEDAAYRIQWAYEQLNARYQVEVQAHNELKQRLSVLLDDGK